MNLLHGHNKCLSVERGLSKTALVAVLVFISISAVSCRSVKEVHYVTDTISSTDTLKVFIHDTTKIKEVKHDSVDRYVEKTVYVDSNGVVHEKEVEMLNHYIYLQDEKYNVMESYYNRKISELKKEMEEKKEVEYIEKELTWFQKTMIVFGWCFIFALASCGVILYFYIKNRRKD